MAALLIIAYSQVGLLLQPARAAGIPLSQDAESYLHTQGRNIVDRNGNVVVLRGVNIGGWLVTEGWMCGQRDNGGRGALEQLEARFGVEKAAALMQAWQSNWFTRQDLDDVAREGFNMIRVPFSWRNLQDAGGNWIRNEEGDIDFSRFDWIVREAAARGIYVVFDFHYWPRQLEPGNYGLPSRWTPEGIAVRSHMAVIWSQIARHFLGNGAVAAFDVINEPEGSPYNAPQHAFSNAIRQQDPDRMIIVEWSGYQNTPSEFPDNTVYSDHYAFADEPSYQKYLSSLEAYPSVKVPLFLGEMKCGQDTAQSAAWMASTMNAQGWSWAIWTHKGVNVGGWASHNYDSSMTYNLGADSYSSILNKWTQVLGQWRNQATPQNYSPTTWWETGYRQAR